MQRIFMKHSKDDEYQPFDYQASTETYEQLARRVGFDSAQDHSLRLEIDGGRQHSVVPTDSMTLVDGTYIEFFWNT